MSSLAGRSNDLSERSATKRWGVSQRCSANARRRRRYKSLDKKGRTSPPGLCSVSSGRLDHAAMQHGSFGAMSAASHDFVASVNPRRFRAAWQLFRRSEEHTSELQSLMRISYAVFCLNKKTLSNTIHSLLSIINY